MADLGLGGVPEGKKTARLSIALLALIIVTAVIGTFYGTKYFLKLEDSVNMDLKQEVEIFANADSLATVSRRITDMQGVIDRHERHIIDLEKRLKFREDNCKCK